MFIALAFLSEHPKAPAAAVKAMGLALLVGIPVSALASDAVTGLIAGVGAGGIVALRADADHRWKARAIAVALATFYVFFLLRTATGVALLMGPILPFTGIGVADHLSERKRDRERQAAIRPNLAAARRACERGANRTAGPRPPRSPASPSFRPAPRR